MSFDSKKFTVNFTAQVALLLGAFSISPSAHSDESATDRALKRYEKADRSTFMGKVKTEKGAVAETSLAVAASAKILWNQISRSRAANKRVSPILEVAYKTKKIDELFELRRVTSDTLPSGLELRKRLVGEIDTLEAELTELKASPRLAFQIEEIEAKLGSTDGTLDADAFIKEAKIINQAEQEEFRKTMRGSQSKIKKILVGGVLLYIVFDGAARYVIATRNDRDPTLVPLAGLVAWGIDEGGRVVSGKADAVKNFFKSGPEKFNKAVDDVKHSASEEADKVKKSVNPEDAKK